MNYKKMDIHELNLFVFLLCNCNTNEPIVLSRIQILFTNKSFTVLSIMFYFLKYYNFATIIIVSTIIVIHRQPAIHIIFVSKFHHMKGETDNTGIKKYRSMQ